MTTTLVPALLMTAAALGGSSRGVVLDFSATWCGPCQQMSPIVSRLERQGYAIRKVDVDQEQELAQRFNITGIPAFVLVVDGKEVTRISGATSEEQLRRLLAQIPSDPLPVAAAPTRPSPPERSFADTGGTLAVSTIEGVGQQQPSPAIAEEPAPQPARSGSLLGRLMGRKDPPAAGTEPPVVRGNLDDRPQDPGSLLPVRNPQGASVRVHVTINGQTSIGSGTAVDSRTGRTVIATCGHLFQNWNEQSKVEVDVFTEAGIQKYVGRMVNYDIAADVGLVTIPTDVILATAQIPDVDGRPRTGEPAVNIGCSGGAAPTQEAVQVTALNYFEGPDNIECTGVPVQGRSGGGLFNHEGQLIGICIGADAQRQRGAYAGLLAIHDQLNAAGMTALYRRTPHSGSESQLLATTNPAPGMVAVSDTNVPAHGFDAFAGAATDSTLAPAAASVATGGTENAVGGGPAADADVEVICIIRNRRQPAAPSRVVIIDRPSPKFLSYLGGELASTAMTQPPASVQTNHVTREWEPSDPPQLADPQSVFRPTTSRPLFTSPGQQRTGERSRSQSLQPTALEQPVVPQRYVRSPQTRP